MSGSTDTITTPPRAVGHLPAARAAEREGRTAEAEAAYRAAVREDPSSSAAALGLVRLLDRRGDRAAAQDVLETFVSTSRTNASLMAAARQWEQWEGSPLPNALTVRVALTGSGTLAPLGAHLRVACAQARLHPFVHVGGYGQWAQDLLSPASELYAFAPDIILVPLQAAEMFPLTMTDPDAAPAALAAERSDGLRRIGAVIEAVSRHAPGATLALNTFAIPDRSPFGILDLKVESGQRERINALNAELVALTRDRRQVVVVDQDRVEARFGKGRVRDARLWYLGSVPFSEAFLPVLAAEYMRIIRPLKGLVRKCIVLDLDNTLWGGVAGEDGFEGIKIGGNDAPGNAFRDFQLALSALRRRGILLALCSKNNPDDVWRIIDSHPHMVLRRKDFAATRVNWTDKVSNIVDIARELNLGLDSFVFIDDNPAERALVAAGLPAVLTVDLPADPAFYTETLAGLDVFESLGVTAEDKARGDMYLQAEARREFEQSVDAGGLKTHLEALDISVSIERATAFSIPRIAQLINKTNQFNMTTRRYTEAQVRTMAAAADTRVYGATVSDRFGDFGLTGVAIVRNGGDTWVIDSFLLSCRVLGRGVEDALLAHVVSQAQNSGARRLEAHFSATPRNAPAQGFYAARGFQAVEKTESEGGVELFELALDSAVPATDHLRWLRVSSDDGDALEQVK
jgi:FkbH-like protein